MISLLKAEVLKVRTTRAVWALLASAALLTGLAVAGAVFVGGNAGVDLESEQGVALALHVSAAGAVFVMVLGMMMTAGEFRHGTATETYLTTPARWPVLLAKIVVAGGLGVVFGAVTAGVAFGVANHAYQIKGFELPADSQLLRSILLGSIVYAALFGAVGAALGGLVRNQVAVIVGGLAWLLVAEQIIVNLAPGLGRYLPAAAGRALVRDPNGELLSQPSGALVLAGYAAAFMLLAMLAERRRDA